MAIRKSLWDEVKKYANMKTMLSLNLKNVI